MIAAVVIPLLGLAVLAMVGFSLPRAERASIMNMFEERRAVYGVLSTLGVFPEAVKGQRAPLMTESIKPKKPKKS